MNPQDEYDLEIMVDEYGIAAVVEALAEIAGGKADHVRTNWQDYALARAWESASAKLDTCAGRIAKGLSATLP